MFLLVGALVNLRVAVGCSCGLAILSWGRRSLVAQAPCVYVYNVNQSGGELVRERWTRLMASQTTEGV